VKKRLYKIVTQDDSFAVHPSLSDALSYLRHGVDAWGDGKWSEQMKRLIFLSACFSLIASVGIAQTIQSTILVSKDPSLSWKSVLLPTGVNIDFTLGVGSAAFRHRSDPPDVF